MAQLNTRSLENYQVMISTSTHAVISDEPKTVGDGLGPNPYELLLGALGSCTVMTLQMYARRKNWPLEGVSALLSFDRVHAEDCAECEAETGLIERIQVQLHVEGDLTPEQTERLSYIATRCPVRKTLAGGPVIVDTLV